jgi:hypothetical protein
MTAATETRRRPASAASRKAKSSREAWLIEMVRALRPLFRAANIELPPVRVSVGWPGGKRSKNLTLGQCWSPTNAADNRAQIFISPTVGDGRRVIDILVHELCHAADRNEHGHAREFAELAYAVGLEGKPTDTHAGPELAERASSLVKRLGKYPHAALIEMTDGTKKQTTRMMKLECRCPEPRILRVSRKVHDQGAITCGVCEDTFTADAATEEGEPLPFPDSV